jgi:hypothetical protein
VKTARAASVVTKVRIGCRASAGSSTLPRPVHRRPAILQGGLDTQSIPFKGRGWSTGTAGAARSVLEEISVDVCAGDGLGLGTYTVKIDVERAEHDVLLGWRDTIEATRPSLIGENCVREKVTPLLRDLGYEPYCWESPEPALVQYAGTTATTSDLRSGRLAGLPVR